MESDNYQLVAAIDFGTTYTGYGFLTRHDLLTDPTKVNLMVWNAGSTALTSQKAPTCVLFDKDQTFHSFGYEAEDNFNELYLDDNHEDWYLFRRFKMDLYKDKVTRNLMLETLDGKKMSALKVISAVILYLKNHLLKKIADRAVDIKEPEIRWVLTVPAIWSDSAKQIMREAAEMAHIPTDQLMMVLEPEAASMLCKHLSAIKCLSPDTTEDDPFQSGSKYLVLDAGGGTIDITVHEVLKGGFLKEIHSANGGDWGGTKVDEAFEELLQSIIGKPAYRHFSVNKMPNVIELQRIFEERKRCFTGKNAGTKITFRIPLEIKESFEQYNNDRNLADVIAANFSLADIDLKHDKMRLSHAMVLDLFKPSLKHITDHITSILQKPELHDCKTILMVGGYSECIILQEAVGSVTENIRVIVPGDASLAVLKGAVINGFTPDVLSHRVCRYTYGTDCMTKFVEGVHKEEYRVIDARGEISCAHFFDKFITKDTQIRIGTSSVTKGFDVVFPKQTVMGFRIYASTSADPMYVTDDNVHEIGYMCLDMPDTSLGLERWAMAMMYFGGSEIEIKAVDEHTGNTIRTSVDFLG